ncbi:glycosyltransferase family 2 protein [Micromonospora sp. NPDC004704]
MSNVISVITPVYPPNAAFLIDAYRSLVEQELPDRWQWEWVVQEDGQSGAIADLLPDDPRISFGTGRHAGPAVARNIALVRSSGQLVKALDADDLLTPGALHRDISIHAENKEIGWTATSALDLLPDGSTISWNQADPSEGIMPAGSVFDYWLSHDYQPPVVPGTMCIRRDLIIALGGWMALPASEDTGLLVAASTVRPGYFIATPGLLYRKWPLQSTAQPAHNNEAERFARAAVIEARVWAMIRGGWAPVAH